MQKSLNFTKISAAGNDFIMFDNRKKVLPKNISGLAKRLCHRKFSIGADGLLILEESKKVDFRMRYLNSDGSVAAMCGNGGRSIARFANILGIVPKKMRFETDAGMLSAEIIGKNVRLWMGEPKDSRMDFTLRVDKREFDVSFMNTGVPHVVIFVNDIEKLDVASLGQMVRYHREFAPDGTNVDFVQRKDSHTLLVRTYERGVEDETLACGTGVTASAIVGGLKGFVIPPVSCVTHGGYVLKVSFNINATGDFVSPVSNVYLEGPADITFSGKVEI